MKARKELLSSEGIENAEPLIPAISSKGVNATFSSRSDGLRKRS